MREKLLTLRKFKVSRDFYIKLEARGASIDERIAALKRILIKFRNIDADLSGMEKKLERLQEVRVGEGEELEKFEEFEVEKETAAPTIEAEIEEEVKEVEDLEEFKEFKPQMRYSGSSLIPR